MLYFSGYRGRAGSWTAGFNRAVTDSLRFLGVSFCELPPYDWSGPGGQLREYLRIPDSAGDTWFVGWAQSHLIELLTAKKGRKFGLVVGLTAGHFDPLVFTETESGHERRRLNLYDGIFANSHWCRSRILAAYPELAGKVTVTGFPIDFSVYEPYTGCEKEDDLVVFNQRFAPERLHSLQVELARLLAAEGFRVRHLTGTPPENLSGGTPTLLSLLDRARDAGLEFVFNPTSDRYLHNLGKAAVVVTTSSADMLPSSLIEAIHLGCVPVAPDAFCFPEFVHPDNLYPPYDLKQILHLVKKKPKRRHHIRQYSARDVVGRMLAVMGYFKNGRYPGGS